MEAKLNELLKLKYNVNLVEFDDSEGVYRLIQRKNGIADLEDVYVAPEIINFNYGEIYTGKPKKLIKKKQSQKLKILDEDENDNIENTTQPTYNDDGTVTWNNTEYQNIWNNIPSAYKKALMEDREWLTKTMNNYVENKRQQKRLEFVNPSNLIIPPQILDNGSYDFGNKTYNNIFNKYDKSYQNTLLSLYSEQNGVKNYDMMINALNNIVQQELRCNIRNI
jgi:phage gpG-like protein